jgi:hypothetical protein
MNFFIPDPEQLVYDNESDGKKPGTKHFLFRIEMLKYSKPERWGKF